MKIYTRTGDGGETGLFGGGRVRKDHVRVQAYGAVDELSASLGLAASLLDAGDPLRARITLVQEDLFAIGAHLATPPRPEGRRGPELPSLPTRVPELEAWIDECDDVLPPLRAFILPGGAPAGAALHVARTVCRRAERAVTTLAAGSPLHPSILVYLNRLSDLLFALARMVNHGAGSAEIQWRPAPEDEAGG